MTKKPGLKELEGAFYALLVVRTTQSGKHTEIRTIHQAIKIFPLTGGDGHPEAATNKSKD
jgi:hypothetical protein